MKERIAIEQTVGSPKHTDPKKFFHADTPARTAFGIPILTYHRVASAGPAGLERFRVDPTLFDEQLSALRQYGYSAIGLTDGVEVLSERADPTGKPVIITFDDGYRDFLTALPSLQKYRFDATVFLVAGRIGGFADWDSCYGEAAPLMSWPEILEIAGEGTELGCHSLTHRPMTEMNYSDLLRDTCQARKILEDRLETSITHFAYPYGAENEIVRNVIAELRFSSAVSCRSALARLGDEILCLPRIEVPGSCTPEELIVQIDDCRFCHQKIYRAISQQILRAQRQPFGIGLAGKIHFAEQSAVVGGSVFLAYHHQSPGKP